MLVLIKTVAGKTITLDDVEEHHTILDIKTLIFKKEGIPIENQVLVYAGKVLNDSTLYNKVWYEIALVSSNTISSDNRKHPKSILDKYYNELGEIPLETLGDFFSNISTNSVEIKLHNNHFGNFNTETLEYLFSRLSNAVDDLKLPYCPLRSKLIAILRTLKKNNKHFRSLKLVSNDLGNHRSRYSFLDVVESLPYTELLDLSNNELSRHPELASILSKLPSYISSLDLSENQLNEFNLETLLFILKNIPETITLVNLSKNKLFFNKTSKEKDTFLEELSKIRPNTRFILSDNGESDFRRALLPITEGIQQAVFLPEIGSKILAYLYPQKNISISEGALYEQIQAKYITCNSLSYIFIRDKNQAIQRYTPIQLAEKCSLEKEFTLFMGMVVDHNGRIQHYVLDNISKYNLIHFIEVDITNNKKTSYYYTLNREGKFSSRLKRKDGYPLRSPPENPNYFSSKEITNILQGIKEDRLKIVYHYLENAGIPLGTTLDSHPDPWNLAQVLMHFSKLKMLDTETWSTLREFNDLRSLSFLLEKLHEANIKFTVEDWEKIRARNLTEMAGVVGYLTNLVDESPSGEKDREAQVQFTKKEWNILVNKTPQTSSPSGPTTAPPKYPSSYARLFRQGNSPLNAARFLLDDYTKGGKFWKVILYGHWNRHHFSEMVHLVQLIDDNTLQSKEALINKFYEIKLHNPHGSLARRMAFIFSQLEETNEPPSKNLSSQLSQPANQEHCVSNHDVVFR